MTQTKNIGRTQVNPVGIGTWMIGGGIYPESKTTYAVHGNETKEVAALRYSIEQGQNHIDTAQMYGAGHTEEVVGEALKGLDRNSLFIASKVWKSHATAAAVSHATRGMLQRLQIQSLDLLYVHAPFAELEMAEYMQGLADAKEAGLCEYIGVSNFSLEQLKQAQDLCPYPITAVQNHFNLLHKAEFSPEMREYCVEQNIAMVAYRPLGRGMLAGECTNGTILKLAKKYEATPAQIALNWLCSLENMHAIPKSTSQKNIEENIAALSFEISSEDLDTLSALPDEPQK